MSEYTEEELAGLSEEEREAITGDDENADTDDDNGSDDELTGDDESTGDDDNSDNGSSDGGQDGSDDDSDDDSQVDNLEGKTPPPPADIDTPQSDASQLSKDVAVRLPESVAQQFQDRLKELATKFDDGDIALSEMLDERDKINREIYNAEVELAEQTKAANAWQAAQDVFFNSSANAIYLQDQKRYDDLNLFVKTIAARNDNTSFADVLAKAAKMEAAMNGAVAPPAESDKSGKEADKTAGKNKKPKSPLPAAPNIADIPASAPNVTNGGEFAHMDSLSGIAYENALAKMSDDQRERYLRS